MSTGRIVELFTSDSLIHTRIIKQDLFTLIFFKALRVRVDGHFLLYRYPIRHFRKANIFADGWFFGPSLSWAQI